MLVPTTEMYDTIYHGLPDYLQKWLQRVQRAAASFLLGRYIVNNPRKHILYVYLCNGFQSKNIESGAC